jgi:hypothetical protein
LLLTKRLKGGGMKPHLTAGANRNKTTSNLSLDSQGGAMTKRRGFWRELISRSNDVVSTMAVISLAIAAPIVGLSCGALVYDIFYLGYGLTDVSVKLLLGLIAAATGGLAVSQFSKRTLPEMLGKVPEINKPKGEGNGNPA